MKESFEKIDKLAKELYEKKHDTSKGGAYIILALPEAHSERMIDAVCGHPLELMNLLAICMANDPKLKNLCKVAIGVSESFLGSDEK